MRTVVAVSRRGAIALPARLLEALGVKEDGMLLAETTSEGLLLRPVVTLPLEEFDDSEAELASWFDRRK